jgi:hypothetical protein
MYFLGILLRRRLAPSHYKLLGVACLVIVSLAPISLSLDHPVYSAYLSLVAMKIVSTFVAAFVAAALGMPMSDVVHEKRDDMPAHILKRSVAADTLVPVRIALKQRNLESGMDFLMDV